MNTRFGCRCRARNAAARWFAPVPETVWIEAILVLSLEVRGPKMRSFARLRNLGDPAMPRYSWVASLSWAFAWKND